MDDVTEKTYIDVWLRIPEGEEESEAEANTRVTETGFAVDWSLTAVGLITSRVFDTLADAYDWLEAEGFADYSPGVEDGELWITTYRCGHDFTPDIASGTDPWVEIDGVVVDVLSGDLRAELDAAFPVDNDCENGCRSGVLVGCGIERCDSCMRYDGDLEAAQAVADIVNGTVRYQYDPTTLR